MSIWSSVEGTVSVRKDSNISIKKILQASYDEVAVSVDTVMKGDFYEHSIVCRVCLDGEGACEWVRGFISAIKGLEKSARISLELNVRWEE